MLSTTLPAPGVPPRTAATRSARSSGASGVIQSRESMSSVAIAEAMKCLRWPQNERTPNHTTPFGCARPRANRLCSSPVAGAGRTSRLSAAFAVEG